MQPSTSTCAGFRIPSRFSLDGLNQYSHGMTVHFGFCEKPSRARSFTGFRTWIFNILNCMRHVVVGKSGFSTASFGWVRERSSGRCRCLRIIGVDADLLCGALQFDTARADRSGVTPHLVFSLCPISPPAEYPVAQILLMLVLEGGWLAPFPVA
jgi:hypothetical protein